MDHGKTKKFLELPRYGGGKEELKKFIAANLRYPKAALEARIEGKVLVAYEIDDNGFVHNPRVVKGIGYGCDEEAVRVVSLLRYKKVKNRGVRVRVNAKTHIIFTLPKTSISYTLTSESKKEAKSGQTDEKKSDKVTYGYTINY